MPKVDIKRDALFRELNKQYTQDEFEILCFEYGIELDDVTSEAEMQKKETGQVTKDVSTDVIYKIDVPANRYDLLCLEGLSTALNVFIARDGSVDAPSYHLTEPPASGPVKLIVSPTTQKVRPVCVAAVLRNIQFDKERYASFIDLQDKLHQNIGRKRTLVSIGTHDLDTIQGPFTYTAERPQDIKFIALGQKSEMDAAVLMKHFVDSNSHLKKYVDILKDEPLYPVIRDANGVVCSLPPIINGEHSKITLNTKNVLIEVTATDHTKAHIVLNTVVAMFSKHCAPQWAVEQVEIHHADGSTARTPDLKPTIQTAKVDYINSAVGLSLSPEDIARLLHRMSLRAELADDKREVRVHVPVTRSDILHACDIMEDVAIAYGFNNLHAALPATNTQGKQLALNKISDLLRAEIAMSGYTEVLAFALCSRDDNFRTLNRPDDGSAVIISKPKTLEFQCGRLSLLSGVLKSVASNKASPLPIKLFEVGDVFGLDAASDTGSSNQRRLCALYCASAGSGFEVIHGLLDRIMLLLRIPRAAKGSADGYRIEPSADPAFFPGRSADIIVGGKAIGVLGVVHPEVLAMHDIPYPCSALEIQISTDIARAV